MQDNYILTNKQCDVIEDISNNIAHIGKEIASSVLTFKYAINDPTIQEWVTSIEVGQELKKDVERYNQMLDNLAVSITKISENTKAVAEKARTANKSI